MNSYTITYLPFSAVAELLVEYTAGQCWGTLRSDNDCEETTVYSTTSTGHSAHKQATSTKYTSRPSDDRSGDIVYD